MRSLFPSPLTHSRSPFPPLLRDPHKHTLDDHRVHIYDVFHNVLSETRRIPEQTRTVFHDFCADVHALDDEGCLAALKTGEQAFVRLENEVERILVGVVHQIRAVRARESPPSGSGSGSGSGAGTEVPQDAAVRRFEVSVAKREREALLRYFVFLRYRNSDAYRETLGRLTRRIVVGETVVQARHAWHRVRRRAVLGSFHAFLYRGAGAAAQQTRPRFEGFDCWRFLDAEICLGVASEEQQFVLPDTCCASLDGGFGGDPWA